MVARARALRLAGYEVTLAHDGLRALGFTCGQRFDALLTDLTMPSLATGSPCSCARSSPIFPIVLMTAADRPPAADSLWAAVVRKPFGIDHLLAAVEAAVGLGDR